jgi:hypothetical protein
MIIDFPSSPSVGDVVYVDDKSWEWNGSSWDATIYGVTAYQIAQLEGFVGTRSEWLDSLVGTTTRFSTLVGDGSTTEFTVTHGFNSQEVIVSTFSDEEDPPAVTDIKLSTLNTVLVVFDRAPLVNSARLVIIL